MFFVDFLIHINFIFVKKILRVRMEVRIEKSWKEQLVSEFDKPYFTTLTDFVRKEYAERQIFPPAKLIFNAFDSCPFGDVKVVILGQDPYHGIGQAHGLCFSVQKGIQTPPSLVNIYKEIEMVNIENELDVKVRLELEQNQREYLLKEKIKLLIIAYKKFSKKIIEQNIRMDVPLYAQKIAILNNIIGIQKQIKSNRQNLTLCLVCNLV